MLALRIPLSSSYTLLSPPPLPLLFLFFFFFFTHMRLLIDAVPKKGHGADS
jgi:hypothetical protein